MKRNIVLYRMCLLLLVVTCISVSGRALSNTVFALQQQRVSVSGLVVDESGEGLIGASVVEVGTNNRAVTDLNGRFTLSVTPHAVLEFKYVGYETLKISASKDMHVVLKAEQTNLNEV
ncbi:MAG: TonB-dependent receptor, partial [Prevotella sp.]